MIKNTKTISNSIEYLAHDRASQFRNEFIFNTIIPLAGASKIHNYISLNLILILGNFLKKSTNDIFQSDMRTINPLNNSFFYPDIVVSEGRAKTIEDDILTNPLLIIEVLSSSTAVFDKTDKFIACRTIESLKEYILVSQEIPQIEIFSKDEVGNWTIESINGLEKEVTFKTIDFTCKMTEIYEKVF